MHVTDLLADKGAEVATVTSQTPVGEVVAELARHRVGALVVSPDGRHIEGIVSERDIVRHLSEVRQELLDEPVSTIMSTKVRTCGPDDEVETLMQLMTEQRIRHVPVVVDEVLVGIVSIGEVVKSRMGELQRDRDELLEYISAR